MKEGRKREKYNYIIISKINKVQKKILVYKHCRVVVLNLCIKTIRKHISPMALETERPFLYKITVIARWWRHILGAGTSQLLRGRGRQISVDLRPTWSTE